MRSCGVTDRNKYFVLEDMIRSGMQHDYPSLISEYKNLSMKIINDINEAYHNNKRARELKNE